MKNNKLPAWRLDNLYSFFVAICVSVFAFAGIYFGIDKRLTRIEDKVDIIATWTVKHQEQTVSLSERMNQNVKDRDKEISVINQQIAAIKTILKIQ